MQIRQFTYWDNIFFLQRMSFFLQLSVLQTMRNVKYGNHVKLEF